MLPVTSSGLARADSTEIVSSGVLGLDAMLRGGGFFSGSSILLSGVAGTGKTTPAASGVGEPVREGDEIEVIDFW